MQLLIVTPILPPEIGGPATYVVKLRELLSQKYNFSIIGFSNEAEPFASLVEHVRLDQPGLRRQWQLFFLSFKKAHRADLVYIQGTLTVGVAALIAAKLSKKPSVLKFVGDEVWERARSHQRTQARLEDFYQGLPWIYLPLVIIHRLVLRFIDRIIVPSEYLKDFLINAHDINPEKIEVIHNAIEAQPHPKISKNKNQLVYVGRLEAWKHVDKVIRALALARQENPWKLVVVGDGSERQKLEEITRELNLSEAVEFVGSQPKEAVMDYIQSSQKLILYSDYEGLSHTLVEAMKMGTQVIASDIPPNREALQAYATFVPLDTIPQLAEAIDSSSSDTIKARKYANESFSWEKNIDHLTAIFEELVN